MEYFSESNKHGKNNFSNSRSCCSSSNQQRSHLSGGILHNIILSIIAADPPCPLIIRHEQEVCIDVAKNKLEHTAKHDIICKSGGR